MEGYNCIKDTDHDLCNFQEELHALDLGGGDPHHLNMTALVQAFKRKSFLLMPLKHQSIETAYARFEQLNAAFLKVCLIFHLNCPFCSCGGHACFNNKIAFLQPSMHNLL